MCGSIAGLRLVDGRLEDNASSPSHRDARLVGDVARAGVDGDVGDHGKGLRSSSRAAARRRRRGGGGGARGRRRVG